LVTPSAVVPVRVVRDAPVEGKADLMITDGVENESAGETASRNPLPRPSERAVRPLRPRDPIFAAYVNQWLNLLDLSGEHQTILARWML
jgi:hypothetical protein